MLMTVMTGCVKTRTSPPPELIHDSKVLGMTGVRTWAFEHSQLFEEDLTTSVKQAQRYSPTRHLDASGHFNILTLSGGGANGAFGAGILCGWSAAGTRPTFKMVTGISTGALIAPFAFLGADYDRILKQVYTSVETEDIVNLRFFKYIGRGVDSLADSSPLQGLLEKYVTEDVIRSVALAHQTGRRLYIGTTDLDASRLVIWNMGVIAASDTPEAFDLFRKILLASASIPILFPPVYIPVEVGGEIYEEMHADGGVATQVFFYGDIVEYILFKICNPFPITKRWKSISWTSPKRRSWVFLLTRVSEISIVFILLHRGKELNSNWSSFYLILNSIPRSSSILR
jgi:hypothetical protein